MISGVGLTARATWYAWLLTGFYLYSVNLQGNVVPFLQAEFALSYRAVSLHSSAIAVGIILVGLLGDRVEARLGRRRTLWLGIGGLASGSTLLCLSTAPWASIAAGIRAIAAQMISQTTMFQRGVRTPPRSRRRTPNTRATSPNTRPSLTTTGSAEIESGWAAPYPHTNGR